MPRFTVTSKFKYQRYNTIKKITEVLNDERIGTNREAKNSKTAISDYEHQIKTSEDVVGKIQSKAVKTGD